MTAPCNYHGHMMSCLHCQALIELQLALVSDPFYPVIITCGSCRKAMIQESESSPFRQVIEADWSRLRQNHPQEFAVIMQFLQGEGHA